MAGEELDAPLHAEQEYRTIEAALLEMPRGRWFLAEHSRRSRRLESAELEDAIGRLKTSLRDPPAVLGRLRTELDSIAQLLRQARSAVLLRTPANGSRPTPPAAGGAEASAPAGLLKAAEELHTLVWSLQARDVNREVCERIGRQAAAIFALSARQAQESERALQFAEMIDGIARRIMAALETIELELADQHEPAQLGSYATPDLSPLDALFARPSSAAR
jgi:hypothetical protein